MFGPGLRLLDEVEPVAWMDPDPCRAEAAAGQYGGAACADYETLIADPGVDAVIVGSPPWEHREQVVRAAAAGKHVLCEKPMARDVGECRTMIEACRTAGVVLMVGFMKRFDPALCMAAQMVEAGELGEIIETEARWEWPQYFLAGWRDTARCGGGLFQDHGSHTVDLARWWLGDITRVSASVRILLEGREVEDYAHCVCTHSSGAVSIHHHSRLSQRTPREHYRIEGTRGALVLEAVNRWTYQHLHPFQITLHRNTQGLDSTAMDITPRVDAALDREVTEAFRYSRELGAFTRCVLDGSEPEVCSGEDGLRAIQIIDAAYISAAERRVVELPLDPDYDIDVVLRALGGEPRIRRQ